MRSNNCLFPRSHVIRRVFDRRLSRIAFFRDLWWGRCVATLDPVGQLGFTLGRSAFDFGSRVMVASSKSAIMPCAVIHWVVAK
jgi:hypothetical protein